MMLVGLANCQQTTDRLRDTIRDHITGQLYFAGSGEQRQCQKNCKDQLKYCGLPQMMAFCNRTDVFSFLLKSKCPRACGICKPCDTISARSCMPGNKCQDTHKLCPIFLAPKFCKDEKLGYLVSRKCKRSCGVCIPCGGLIPAPDCSNECKDGHKSCPYWAREQDHCKKESLHHEWMMNNCKMSCGVCKPCGGIPPPAPNSGLVPPTERPVVQKVCDAHCDDGLCQGREIGRSQCACLGSRKEAPTCSGRCVVHCPKPRDYRGNNWRSACEGRRQCTCITNPNRSGVLGALCA
ncbi:unnamed protein product [Clavelina lepadiformis]|uniref:ShKT domain-containing protein n=1 Tax=Clavelina lepadiformis TaxID=159417 RepID=A0ABP0EZN8_CLALP